jgi:hypothetical protein
VILSESALEGMRINQLFPRFSFSFLGLYFLGERKEESKAKVPFSVIK